jgi:hypothetical protein
MTKVFKHSKTHRNYNFAIDNLHCRLLKGIFIWYATLSQAK